LVHPSKIGFQKALLLKGLKLFFAMTQQGLRVGSAFLRHISHF
jgi:hypothetical protein